jgi:hypothetical protein
MTVTKAAKEIQNVTKKGVVVMWGGTKDVGKNEALLEEITTQALFKCVSHTFDLHVNSCVNKELKVFNRKLSKHMKAFEYTALLK